MLWLVSVVISSLVLKHEIDETFDTTMRQSASRILPLATNEIDELVFEDDEEDEIALVENLTKEGANFTYLVLAPNGQVVLFVGGKTKVDSSTTFQPGFSAFDGARAFTLIDETSGFGIVVKERAGLRAEILGESLFALILPLALIVPLIAFGVVLIVRRTTKPLQFFGKELMERGGGNLQKVKSAGHPRELKPIIEETNNLLERLEAALEAERNFAAENAHELRTPIAGAIAQLQLVKNQTTSDSAQHGLDQSIQALKKLARTAEHLLQVSRVEAGFATSAEAVHLNPILALAVRDMRDVEFDITETETHTFISPDAFSMVARNLLSNAQKHQTPIGEIKVMLSSIGLTVENECPVVAQQTLENLAARFNRGGKTNGAGAGLGLTIVSRIATSIEGELVLQSPIPEYKTGFRAQFLFQKSLEMAEPKRDV
ncbi:MAG: ATP-binding protein [Paracoccaceae bacterium]|nr:ATP-binding protein [Paracoccaceae bacterium]